MPRITTPTGIKLPNLEVTGLDKLIKTLPECIEGNTTLLFLSTHSEPQSKLDYIEKLWDMQFKEDKKYTTFYVSIVLDPIWGSPILSRYIREGAKREIGKPKWRTTTTVITTEEDINKWLTTAKIPISFEKNKEIKKTLDFPIILLIDNNGIIKDCIIGYEHHLKDNLKEELLRLVEKAQTMQPKSFKNEAHPPEQAGIGSLM